MVKSWLVQDQTVLGKDYSNLLIADSLLKTIWFINAPCYGNEALASPKANELTIPEQTATGKGTSNPFMAGSLPKTTKPTTSKCPKEVPRLRWYRGLLPQMALAGILPFSLLDDIDPVAPFECNGVTFEKGYYLADGICSQWASFVKSFTVASSEKNVLYKRKQEGARKDIERAFGVLQRRFGSFAISNQTKSKVLKALYVVLRLYILIKPFQKDSSIGFGAPVGAITRTVGLTTAAVTSSLLETPTTELHAKNKAKLSADSGYVAPKYLSRGKLSDKSDFYAFGVVLHELLIGRRPVEKMSPSLFQYIVTWAKKLLAKYGSLVFVISIVVLYVYLVATPSKFGAAK
ncbi:ALP1-like protein isoform X1 [Tanacetum coccineum]